MAPPRGGSRYCVYPHQGLWRSRNICAAAPTWRDEEGPPQLLISGHVPDLSGHVDESTRHRGHSPKIKDPWEETENIVI